MKDIRNRQPLIHCMTNMVVTEWTANGLLAIGASPVMAYAEEEVEDMARAANGLLLNIGTLDQPQIEAMVRAGQTANQAGIPVVLDPVGAGATPFRTKMARRLLREVEITLLRGNSGEIAVLLGEEATVSGVEGKSTGDHETLAQEAAATFNTMVCVTGEVDAVHNGEKGYLVFNGHPWLSKLVGTGCMLGAVLTAALAVSDDPLKASCDALAYYGVAAEQAYQQSKDQGIGTFKEQFLNQIHTLSTETILREQKIQHV